jgi:hypothetical protein
MAKRIGGADLRPRAYVELFEGGKVLLTSTQDDPFLPTFIELDARQATLLFGFLQLHMAERIFFTSPDHKARWLAALLTIGKVYDGKLDPEYASALYILTADLDTWQQASRYVDRDGIDFEALLVEVHFSGGYGVLIRLAGNLFNDRTACNPVDLMRLDDRNFTVALTAFQIRRASLLVADFSERTATIENIVTSVDDKNIDAWLEQQGPDWRDIEKQAEIDLAAIQTDQDAHRFIEKYLAHDLRGRYMAIYRSQRHEMLKTPRQAIDTILSLPPLE